MPGRHGKEVLHELKGRYTAGLPTLVEPPVTALFQNRMHFKAAPPEASASPWNHEFFRHAMNTASPFTIRKPRFQLPAVAGRIERRILVNFRCQPDVLARMLPPPFRPKLINGWGMAGICLIRLGGIRPAFLPAIGGLKSENAAHRIAVEWDEHGAAREGVYIPRRDTNAWFNQLLGGKLFPGVHHAAEFRVVETGDCFDVEMRSDDGVTLVRVHARVTDQLLPDSVLCSLDEASEFFRGGTLGWSARKDQEFDGLELHCEQWQLEPLVVERIESSFFANPAIFPPGSAKFDSAFLMRNIPHEWHSQGRLARKALL